MKIKLIVASLAALVISAGFGPPPAFAHTSTADQSGLRNCLRMSHASFRTDGLCTSYLEKRGISAEEMDMIKSCIANYRQDVNLVEECQPLVARYPSIMLTPYGSIMSPGGTDVSDR